MPTAITATDGHINLGRTVTGAALTGGLSLLIGGSRSKGKVIITYTRTPQWFAEQAQKKEEDKIRKEQEKARKAEEKELKKAKDAEEAELNRIRKEQEKVKKAEENGLKTKKGWC
jgi:hypothetical protein